MKVKKVQTAACCFNIILQGTMQPGLHLALWLSKDDTSDITFVLRTCRCCSSRLLRRCGQRLLQTWRGTFMIRRPMPVQQP